MLMLVVIWSPLGISFRWEYFKFSFRDILGLMNHLVAEIILNKLRYWIVLLLLKRFVWFNLKGSLVWVGKVRLQSKKIMLVPLRGDQSACFSWNPVNENVSSLVAKIIWISCFLCSWTVPSQYDVLKNYIWFLISSGGLD